MTVDVQNTDIRAPLNALDVAPPNTNLPRLDERTLSWVYAVSGEFIDLQPLFWRVDAASINAAAQSMRDDGLGTTAPTFDFGEIDSIAGQGRYYSDLFVTLNNGTVTPIVIVAELLVTDAAAATRGYAQVRRSIASPSSINLGPVYAPPGFVLQVRNETNGGVGDTISVRASAFLQNRGTPAPLVPGLIQNPL